MPNVHFDCHLMVTNPEMYIEPLSKCQINCFTFHYEAQYEDITKVCKTIQEHKIDVGLSVKPKTPINEEIIKLCKDNLVNKVLIMTVEPGFGGQKFMTEMM